jgi:hypothetical protein
VLGWCLQVLNLHTHLYTSDIQVCNGVVLWCNASALCVQGTNVATVEGRCSCSNDQSRVREVI